MKTRIFTAALFALVSLFMLTSCGGSGSTATGDNGTGSLALQLNWPSSAAKTTAKTVYKAPDGVVNIRVTVSAADIPSPIIKNFTASPGLDGNGTVDKVPVGINRTVAVLGMDAGGVILYERVLTGITVNLVANQSIKIDMKTVTNAVPSGGSTVAATGTITLTNTTTVTPVTIYYTTNGDTPTTKVFAGKGPSPLAISLLTDNITPPAVTIKFFSVDALLFEEQMKTATYTVIP